MASTYTPLGVELMATGENAGTWGTKTNTNLNIIEQIQGGYKVQTLNAGGSGANTYSSIPTIHIPEFDNIQSKMGDNSEISTEAIQALLFP